MYEVQKDITRSNQGYLGCAVIVNKKFWDGLPWEIRSALTQAMEEATKYENKIAQHENDAALVVPETTGKTTFYHLSDKGNAEWHQALLPVRKQMEGWIRKDLIDAIHQESAVLGY